MSKFLSKSATKRLPLTTKRARKGFYKGKGGTKEGRVTSKARFIADPLKKLQLVVPDLHNFKVCVHVQSKVASFCFLIAIPFQLKPYIASTVPRKPPESRPQVGTS